MLWVCNGMMRKSSLFLFCPRWLNVAAEHMCVHFSINVMSDENAIMTMMMVMKWETSWQETIKIFYDDYSFMRWLLFLTDAVGCQHTTKRHWRTYSCGFVFVWNFGYHSLCQSLERGMQMPYTHLNAFYHIRHSMFEVRTNRQNTCPTFSNPINDDDITNDTIVVVAVFDNLRVFLV